MKKFSSIATGVLLMCAATFAQNSTPFKVNVGKFSEEYTEAGKSQINSKTLSNFSNRFDDGVKNVMWTKDKDHIDRVYFETDGKVTRAGFNKKGQFLYSITTYKEEMLPVDVWVIVKEKYYHKSIFCVAEVNVMNNIAFIITLEDATSWRKIKVQDDQVTEEQVYLKN